MVSAMSQFENAESIRLMVITRDGVEYSGTFAEIKHSILKNGGEHVSNDGFKEEMANYDSLNRFYNVLEDVMELSEEDRRKRSVVGPDQRHWQNPSVYPFTAMGQIEIGCSGTFVSSNVLQTAGHCVNNKKEWHRYLDVHREKNCDPNKGFKHNWEYAITLQSWVENNYPSRDIAWIVYENKSPISLPMTSLTPAEGTKIYIYGYPADEAGSCLYGTSCLLSVVTERRLEYHCDTYGGDSGSAIYYVKEGRPIIIGVHGYGTNNHVSGLNKGTRITKAYETIAREIISRRKEKI